MIVVETFAKHPDWVPVIIEIAWVEWCSEFTDEEHERWLREAADDARSHRIYSADFIALDCGMPVGVIQLDPFDIEETQDRSTWVCGMIVKSAYRSLGIGTRHLTMLQSFAVDGGVERLRKACLPAWRATGLCGVESSCAGKIYHFATTPKPRGNTSSLPYEMSVLSLRCWVVELPGPATQHSPSRSRRQCAVQ